MRDQRPDVIELLEAEKKWHVQQIRRITIALNALQDEKDEFESFSSSSSSSSSSRSSSSSSSASFSTSSVSWASEISNLFKKYNYLTLAEVRAKLADEGITEALDKKFNPTIYSTLVRKIKQGELSKTEDGKYHRTREGENQLTFEN